MAPHRSPHFLFAAMSGLVLLFSAGPARAEDPAAEPTPLASAAPANTEPATDAKAGEGTPAPKPVDRWLDQMQGRLAGDIDSTVRWVDGFFGERRYEHDSPKANGNISLRTYWKDYEGVTARVRLRAYLPLDNARHRAHAFLGRGDADEIIAGDNGSNGLMTSSKDNDWLMGLGYTPPGDRAGQLSFGAGIKLTWPLDPYVRAAYSFEHEFSDKSLIRIRETVFWQRTEHFGTSTALDLERRLGQDNMLRWASWAKVSKLTSGALYDSRVMLYRNLGHERAVLYAVGMRGDSGEPVPVREYGIFGIYRQRVFRPWLFGEIILGATQLREITWATRKTSWIVGFGFEMSFGDQKAVATADMVTSRLLGERL